MQGRTIKGSYASHFICTVVVHDSSAQVGLHRPGAGASLSSGKARLLNLNAEMQCEKEF